MLHIRPAAPADSALMLALVRELAEYERAPEQVVATESDYLRDGFGKEPRFHAAIAEWSGAPAGFCLYFYNWSTWLGRSGLYLEDLFVRPPFRGKGIGKALLIHLAQVALREKCGRFQWQVLDWNEPALRFYQSLGAAVHRDWLTMRVEGEALRKLAGAAHV
jgi:GNAT superfamily N-acetyltransferase